MAGVNVGDPLVKEEIYQRYLKAFKKGVFNYIKEDGVSVPRKYFSGGMGFNAAQLARAEIFINNDAAVLSKIPSDLALISAKVDSVADKAEVAERSKTSRTISLKDLIKDLISEPHLLDRINFLGGPFNLRFEDPLSSEDAYKVSALRMMLKELVTNAYQEQKVGEIRIEVKRNKIFIKNLGKIPWGQIKNKYHELINSGDLFIYFNDDGSIKELEHKKMVTDFKLFKQATQEDGRAIDAFFETPTGKDTLLFAHEGISFATDKIQGINLGSGLYMAREYSKDVGCTLRLADDGKETGEVSFEIEFPDGLFTFIGLPWSSTTSAQDIVNVKNALFRSMIDRLGGVSNTQRQNYHSWKQALDGYLEYVRKNGWQRNLGQNDNEFTKGDYDKYFIGTEALDAVTSFLKSRGIYVPAQAAIAIPSIRSNVSTNLLIPSVEKYNKEYDAREPNLLQADIVEFAGPEVQGKDVYNSFIFQAKLHSGDKNETTIIAGRVEDRAGELDSEVMFFQQGKDGKWWPIEGAPVFKNSQDPTVKKIGDNFILQVVKVEPDLTRPERAPGKPELVWHEEFFQFKTLDDLRNKQLLARGPRWMKDIRLVELKDGRIVVITRPSGDNYGRHYGMGKVVYFILKDFDEFVRLAHGGIEGNELVWLMKNARVLEGMFRDDEWGGVNDPVLLENGNIGLLAHIARRNKQGEREYAPVALEFNPNTGKFSSLKIIGRWQSLEKLLPPNSIDIKPTDPNMPRDLANVWFGTKLIIYKGRYYLFGGARDTRTVVAQLAAYPFSSPIVNVESLVGQTIESSFMRNTKFNSKIRLIKTRYARTLEDFGQLVQKGGIDLTPANMNLQTQNAGEEITFHLNPSQIAQLQKTPGFVPVIINIQPLKDLAIFLGIK